MEKQGPSVQEVKCYQHNEMFRAKFLVKEISSTRTRDGKTITHMELSDKTGDIHAVAWDNCQVAGKMEPGVVIGVLGFVAPYNGKLQMTIRQVKVFEGEEIAAYLKTPDKGIAELKEELGKYMQSIEDVYLQLLLEHIFTPELWEQFQNAPAAKAIHHNYCGGLMEHTSAICSMSDKVCRVYPDLNRDLLVTGAILHDIGKIEEFSVTPVPDYTVNGRMVGHIVMGYELVAGHIQALRKQGIDFPELLEQMLKNMILSHHGNLEFGSPVIPLFPEAFVLHVLDDMDAKMYVFFNKMNEYSGNTDDPFTPYDTFHGQYFFLPRYQKKDEE